MRSRGIGHRRVTLKYPGAAAKDRFVAKEMTMRAKRSRWCVSIGLVALVLLTGLSSEGLSQGVKGNLYVKKKLNIPYSLRVGPMVTKPDEYTLMIQNEGGQPVLTFISKEGYPVLRSHGEHDTIPEKERDFKGGGRFRIMALPDPKHPGGRWIVFLYDFMDPRGNFVRFRFRIAEATESAS